VWSILASPVSPITEVGAGAEHRSGLTGGVRAEHADPDIRVILETVDRGFQPERHLAVTAFRASGRLRVMTPM
jgi:hypothetical protein